MKVLLIGANGQLGTDLTKTIPNEFLIPLMQSDIEVTDRDQVFSVLRKYSPDIVINTAAYNDVDGAEENIDLAFRVNVYAVKNLVDACNNIDSILVHFSSDYVFGADDTRKVPYTELDKEGPLGIYGISKLCGEKIILASMKKFFLIRTAVLYGVAGLLGKGDNFVETMIRLGKENGSVKVIGDQFISPTYSLNLAQCIWDFVQTEKYGLYHVVSTGGCSRYDFVKKIFVLLSLPIECAEITTDTFRSKAKRPRYSILDNTKYNNLGLKQMKKWDENLKDYLIERGYIH